LPSGKPIKTRQVRTSNRTLIQQASRAIRGILDAVVELVTNSDDRYQLLGIAGCIEVEVERKRGDPSILRVRDYADGMTSGVMEDKLAVMGERVSGMEAGHAVRGTNSRGAKDIAALGLVRFESIAEDGLCHMCEITPGFEFKLYDSRKTTSRLRRRLGVREGTGTLVSLFVEQRHRVPRHENLLKYLSRLVALRDILKDPDRDVFLVDVNRDRRDRIEPPRYDGHNRLKVSFGVPGYPEARAKLVVNRARKRFEREPDRTRLGGILVKSRHAVHEATYFDRALENDPHALWFYGHLSCEFIDDLWNEWDENYLHQREQPQSNPIPVLDPSRRTGLDREHPFVQALFEQVLNRLRPLVEEERRREENQRSNIESQETRKRLDALEKAAIDFMREFEDEEEPARTQAGKSSSSRFLEQGFAVSPPFAKMVVGESKTFSLKVSQEAFPELSAGVPVQADAATDDITVLDGSLSLKVDKKKDILRARWKVRADSPCAATGIAVSAGPISGESLIEVLASKAELYSDITDFGFRRKSYTIRTSTRRKRIKLYAPLEMFPECVDVDVSVSGDAFGVRGQHQLKPKPDLGVAVCSITIVCDGTEAEETITARIGARESSAVIRSVNPLGSGLEIRLEDVDLGSLRHRWQQNVLEIAAQHPSVGRYLGSQSDGYPGQGSRHFRLLLAEIVAEAVCTRIMEHQEELAPSRYADFGWDDYYSEFSRLMTKFLPITHRLQCPEGYNGSGAI